MRTPRGRLREPLTIHPEAGDPLTAEVTGAYASGTTSTGVPDAALTFTARTMGVAGNLFVGIGTVGPSLPLTVEEGGGAIMIHLATDGSETAISTAAEVAAAVAADGPSNALVSVDNAPGNDGSGIMPSQSFELSGGREDGPVMVVDEDGGVTIRPSSPAARPLRIKKLAYMTAPYLLEVLREDDTHMLTLSPVGKVVIWNAAGDTPRLILDPTTGFVGGENGEILFGVAGGGLQIAPTDPGGDNLFLDATNIDPAAGGAVTHVINPPGVMPDGFFASLGSSPRGDYVEGADLDDANPRLLFKAQTTAGRFVYGEVRLGADGAAVGIPIHVPVDPDVYTNPSVIGDDGEAAGDGAIIIIQGGVADEGNGGEAAQLEVDGSFANGTGGGGDLNGGDGAPSGGGGGPFFISGGNGVGAAGGDVIAHAGDSDTGFYGAIASFTGGRGDGGLTEGGTVTALGGEPTRQGAAQLISGAILSVQAGLLTARGFISEPADSGLAVGDFSLWFDLTPGAAKLMVKAKDDNGTIVTGQMALA